jgi:nucleoside 2-deoxyribosyltransferase
VSFRVYLSDTSSDLRDLRNVLLEQISQSGMIPLGLDADDKRSTNVLDIAQDKIESADYFIAIVTYKRAPELPNNNRTLAEMEYEFAQSANKPIAALLPDENSQSGMLLRLRSIGQNPLQLHAQQEFWNKAKHADKVLRFKDDADLTRQFMNLLQAWSQQPGGNGASPAVANAADAMEMESAAPPVQRAAPASPKTTDGLDIDALAESIAQKTYARLSQMQQQDQEALAQQALKVNEALRLKPGELVFGRPAERSQFKSDIFMIMPFADEFRSVYTDLVKPLVADLKLTVLRGDEFLSSRGVIIEDVWAALNACRLVIADITGGNDNVFYELGIAHTLNKPAILITQARMPEEVPFDIRHLRYIAYENSETGLPKLRTDLQAAVTRLLHDLEEGWGSSGQNGGG